MALPSMRRRERGEVAPSRDIFEPFGSLRRDMERLFEDFSREWGWSSPAAPGTSMAASPKLDVSETETEVKVEAELPGVDEKDVEVTLSDGRLTIKGEKKQEKEEKKKDYHTVERSYGSFARSIALPYEADPGKIKATFAKGVLNVTVPKPPEVKAKEKKITIGKG
jgi:HSP20 family protein